MNYKDEDGNVYDEHEVEEMYREYLDDTGAITILGMDYYPSDVLRDVDPIAYRCGLSDYLDMYYTPVEEDEDEED